jgi:hypothetical protein
LLQPEKVQPVEAASVVPEPLGGLLPVTTDHPGYEHPVEQVSTVQSRKPDVNPPF